MSRARALLLALAGLLFPVGLALGVYLTSAGTLAAVPTVIEPPTQIARSATTTVTTETSTRSDTTPTTPTTGDDDRRDDLPGKCKDPDHRLDPDCDPRTAGQDDDDDSSGSGSGGNSSGSGSNGDDRDDGGGGGDSSGHGSGDDD